jgi:hypothetical protein
MALGQRGLYPRNDGRVWKLTRQPQEHNIDRRTKSESRFAMQPWLLQTADEDGTQPLVGIAKLAATGESIRQGHFVEYFTLPSRALLNRCTSAHVPFDWTINPYRGCEFACKYCMRATPTSSWRCAMASISSARFM